MGEMEVKQTNSSAECPLLQDEPSGSIIRDLKAVTGVEWINNGLEFPVKFPNCEDNEIRTRLNDMLSEVGAEFTNNGIECPYSKYNNAAAILNDLFQMGLPEKSNNSIEFSYSEDNGKTTELGSVSSLFVQLPRKAVNFFKRKDSSAAFGLNLEKQLQAWKRNPYWVDSAPKIKQIDDDSLWNLNVEVDVGLPPDAVYNMLTGSNDKRLSKNIKSVVSKKLLVNEDQKQVMEVALTQSWSLLWMSWAMSARAILSNSREEQKVTLKPCHVRFMDGFKGCWDAEVSPRFVDEKVCFPFKPKSLADYHSCTGGKGRLGSRVSLSQGCPAPFLWRLRRIKATPDQLFADIVAESAKVRESLNPVKSYEELNLFQKINAKVRESFNSGNLFEEPKLSEKINLTSVNEEREVLNLSDIVNATSDIKERWSIRRKMSKRYQRRF